ncbi:class I SAM-dependent methyltransferase [Oceanobacillus sp. FSL W8-0428]|uniref:Methyltransferase n=1 Tax=Oceanobacillus sojae TaxID=582851 RepID=A0A511ZFI0_9BACI|nr:class I SAM-dependent methyltransferase [Oceanobacillus sojae]GEN86151.1 methyltransferase [Oceanobacillus sojae]
MFKEYGELSTKLYEITKPVGYSMGGDIEYYYEKLKNRQGPVLEAGVGTGRMLIPFLKEGITIDGVDISAEMLEQCKVNMREHQVNTNLFNQDLLQLDLKQTYQTIIMPTGSFCLLPGNHINAFLQRLYNHLKEGGQFIFDTLLPIDFHAGDMDISTHSLTEDSGILFTSTSEAIDWLEQKVSYIHKYELLRKGAIEKTEISHFILYWYGLKELELLLKNIGFGTVSYEIGYGQENDPSLITFIASKERH